MNRPTPRRTPTNRRVSQSTRNAWGKWLEKFADDPEGAALAAGWAMDEMRQAIEDMGVIRARAVRQLRAEGHSLGEVAYALGISRERVRQIEGR